MVRSLKALAWVAAAAANLCNAAEWYVDASAPGGDGTSWERAWNRLDQINGIAPGDTVNVSGGPRGQTLTYMMSREWESLKGGTPSARITYRIGQDDRHSGIAYFVAGGKRANWLPQVSNITVSGNAGDGQAHFQLGAWHSVILGNGQSGVRLTYIRADDVDLIGDFNPGHALEIDHCVFRITDLAADHATYASIEGKTWDDSTFHDNALYIPNSGNGEGCDGLQWVGSGFSIYHNRIVGYIGRYMGTQHQDGWQGTGGSACIKIYQNYFQDIANYPVFGDAYFGTFSHVYICNNVTVLTKIGIQRSNPPQGYVVCPDGGWYEKNHYWPVFEDIVIANNVIADYGLTHAAVNLRNNAGQRAIFRRCLVANNVSVNSGSLAIDHNVEDKGNVFISAEQGRQVFRRYTPLSPVDDFHPLEGDRLLRGRGVNLTQWFSGGVPTVDAQSRAWDVGAYPYESDERSLQQPD